MQDMADCDYIRTSVIFQGSDNYRFVGDIGSHVKMKAGPKLNPAQHVWMYSLFYHFNETTATATASIISVYKTSTKGTTFSCVFI